jgi:putative transposase
VEERRRLKIVPNAFGERPVLKLMYGAMIRAAERWRGVRMSDFELRQMKALQEELNSEYEATLQTASSTSSDAFRQKIPSRNRP